MRWLNFTAERLASAVSLPLLLLVLCVPLRAQAGAEITGTVTDPSGASVPKSVVEAKEQQTGFVRSTVTDAKGRYDLVVLPAGRYHITVERQGFHTAVHAGIVLTAAEQVVMSFVLQLDKLLQPRRESLRAQPPAPGKSSLR